MAPFGLHRERKKLTLVSRKPQGSIFIIFLAIFINLGPPLETFGLSNRLPSHEKNFVFKTLLEQCTSSGINHHSKRCQISFAFLFLIWARCISENHENTWEHKCFVAFSSLSVTHCIQTSPHLTSLHISPHTPEHHRPHLISSLIVSPHTTSPHREINGD